MTQKLTRFPTLKGGYCLDCRCHNCSPICPCHRYYIKFLRLPPCRIANCCCVAYFSRASVAYLFSFGDYYTKISSSVGGKNKIVGMFVSCQTQCDQCSRIHSFPSGGMRPVALSCSQRGRSHRQGQGNRGTDPFPHGGRSHLLLEKASPYLHALAPARCGSIQEKETTR